jgi:two-component system, OmpR family, response regulator RegX3
VICDQSLRQIVARIRAILRRRDRIRERPEQLVVGWLSLDLDRHEVTVDGHVIDLTYIQFRILEMMMREPARAFTGNELQERIWGEGIAIQDHALDAHIHAIRKKIGRNQDTRSAPANRLGIRISA